MMEEDRRPSTHPATETDLPAVLEAHAEQWGPGHEDCPVVDGVVECSQCGKKRRGGGGTCTKPAGHAAGPGDRDGLVLHAEWRDGRLRSSWREQRE